MNVATKKKTKPALPDVCGRCAAMPGATLDHTFGAETDVYRISDKMFALVNTEDAGFVTLKAPPDKVVALLTRFDFCRPGYYMNKRHWITIDLVHNVPLDDVLSLIDDSYRLVFESLSKKRQAEIRSSQ